MHRDHNAVDPAPHPLWQAAHDKARSRGEKLSDAIRGFLETYVRGER